MHLVYQSLKNYLLGFAIDSARFKFLLGMLPANANQFDSFADQHTSYCECPLTGFPSGHYLSTESQTRSGDSPVWRAYSLLLTEACEPWMALKHEHE
jgi:hypothetical protein